MHLSPEQLIDLAEGTQSERDAAARSHLAECAACRGRLAELRATMASIEGGDVPEPSPIFWDRFQERVSEAVKEERFAGFGRFDWLAGFGRFAIPIGAAAAIAAIAIVVRINSRVELPRLPDGPPQVASAPTDGPLPDGTSRVELLNDSLVASDASLQLVADLTAGIDWNAAGEAGLAASGSAEHAVAHLSMQELLELQRLLQAELANSGV